MGHFIWGALGNFPGAGKPCRVVTHSISLRCPSCGRDNPADASFCGYCGSSMQPQKQCPACSELNPQDTKFCRRCGTELPTPVGFDPRVSLPPALADGRYVFGRYLGEGGRKRVFLAHDHRLDRDVALALIKTEGLDAEARARVDREVAAMGRLGDNPHIVTVYDVGEERNSPYIVSQYMAGGAVEDLLREAQDHRLSPEDVIRIGSQVASALVYAHAKGVVHRDLKPANVWLTADGTAKVGDFGLATGIGQTRLTVEGMMLGTVAYMPPEQAVGRESDARSDIYSLGAMLYEMISGRPPFPGDDAVAVISQHLNVMPVAPSWHNPATPTALETLIMQMLAKSPDERPSSADDVRLALMAVNTATVAEQAPELQNPLDRLSGGIFVGREKEVAELRRGVGEALLGQGSLVLLVGEPGIGKTRTSEELITYASLRGMQTLLGRCYEGEGAPAYWPWIQIIRSYVHDAEAEQLSVEMGTGAADIAQVVSEVKERFPNLPPLPELDPEQARFRLFDSVVTFLRNVSTRKPMLLVLDDMHWADKPSLLLLQFLTRELGGHRMMVLGTYRDVELGRHHPLSQSLAEMARESHVRRILLRGLNEGDVARYIEMSSGMKPPSSLVGAVFKETEGNPFFVTETVRLLVSEGRLDSALESTSWSVTIPQGVREVIGRRLDKLSEDCNKLLSRASVVGREFAMDVLERIDPVGEEKILELLEEALGARVILEVINHPGQYRFSHALVRETLYEELNTTRKVRLHRRTGEVLEEIYGDSPDRALPELAYHFFESASAGDVEKAIDYSVRAANRAVAQLAHEEAVLHFDRALQALELKAPVDLLRKCRLLIDLGTSATNSGDIAKARKVFPEAADLAREIGADDEFARAALGQGDVWTEAGFVNEDLMKLLREAWDRLEGDSALKARVIARLAEATRFSDLVGERELSREAVETARRSGDSTALAQALYSRAISFGDPAMVRERMETASELIAAAELANNRNLQMLGYRVRISAFGELGRFAELEDDAVTYGKLATASRQPLYIWWTTMYSGMRALMDADLEKAEAVIRETLNEGIAAHDPNAEFVLIPPRFLLARESGSFEGIQDHFDALVRQEVSDFVIWRGSVSYYQLLTGDFPAVERSLPTIFADIETDTRDWGWCWWAYEVAEILAKFGATDPARKLYEKVLPFAEQVATPGYAAACYGSNHHTLGLLARAMGDLDLSRNHLGQAVTINSAVGAPGLVARSKYELARTLVESRSHGSQQEALSLLGESLDICRERKLGGLVDKVLDLKLQVQGVDRSDVHTSIHAVADEVAKEKPDLGGAASPDGTITIVFSDIEDSTAMNERLGDQRWVELLRGHDAIVRTETAAAGGVIVKSRGDGFMLAFSSARQALRCAIGIQHGFARHNQNSETPIRVRIGVHTGEVVKEAGDFYGRHVNLAARIADQADGEEILVSELTSQLLAGSQEFRFADSREAELKGFPGSHRMIRVDWRD